MSLYETIERKYGLSEDSPLFNIELKSFDICEMMSNREIKLNKSKLLDELSTLNSTESVLKNKILLLSNGCITEPSRTKVVLEYLLKVFIKHERLKNRLILARSLSLALLEDLKSSGVTVDLVTCLIEFKKTRKSKLKLEAILKYMDGDCIAPKYSTLHLPSGAICSREPNLGTSEISNYVLPEKGKKIVSVSILHETFYALSSVINNDTLKEMYLSEDPYTYLYNFFMGTHEQVIAKEVRDEIKKFVFSRLYDTNMIYREEPRQPEVLNENALILMESLLSTDTYETKDRVTSMGRKLSNSTLSTFISGVFSDFTKYVLVKAYEHDKNLVPKYIEYDNLFYEVDKDVNLHDLYSFFQGLYHEATPREWSPTIISVTEVGHV